MLKDRYGLVPAEIKAMVESEESVERQVGTARYLDKALKAKDPNLGLVFIKPDIAEWDLPVGAVPGRWHIQIKSPQFVTTYEPIVGPNNSFREPASDILDMVDRMDLRKPNVYRDLLSRSERQRIDRRRAADLKSEQMRYDAVSDFKAAKRVAGDGGLTKSKWGTG